MSNFLKKFVWLLSFWIEHDNNYQFFSPECKFTVYLCNLSWCHNRFQTLRRCYRGISWFPPKKTDSNSRIFQDFLSLFPGLFQDFQQNSRTFMDYYGVVRIATTKIIFLQNKNIHPVAYTNNNSFYSKSVNKYLS